MADEKEKPDVEEAEAPQAETLEGGAYDVLRKRLQALDDDLLARVEKLNASRKDVFGGTESAIIGSDRIKTENNCLVRDIAVIGSQLLVGYTVFIGMKAEVKIADVFGQFAFDSDENAIKSADQDLLKDPTFARDFAELFRYYKNARFLQFAKTINHLLMIFQVGERISDIRAFRWNLKGNKLEYVDNRGDQEYKIPAQHDFKWTQSTRDDQVFGKNPHVSIKDKLFVECVGGDLTIKIEDNTETGEGIYCEPVENADQTLDDAKIWYAFAGELILLKIEPYLEKARYFIYNPKFESVVRQDSLEQSCIQLPEGHGIIFPKGVYLESGDYKQFQEDVGGMGYRDCIKSPNGEDFLYVFYQEVSGRYILLQYNLISKKVENPIFCQGYSAYDDGKMILFTELDEEPKRMHALQVWQTPFCSDTHVVATTSGSYLEKVGNRDLVRCISDCYTVSRLINSQVVNILIYQDLINESNGLLDGYHWLAHAEVFNLQEAVSGIKTTALAAVDEYEKVERIRQNTQKQIGDNAAAADKLMKEAKFGSFRSVDDFVTMLNQLRARRGQVISCRELRFADQVRIDKLESELEASTEALSLSCIDFLLRDGAFKDYYDQVNILNKKLDESKKVADLKPLEEELEELSGRLDLLTDVVNNLNIEDTTKTTRIVDAITDVYAAVNRTKALVRNKRKDVGRGEAKAEFAAQYKLLSQSINNYIGLCETPEKCDEFLTKLMITIEELEGKFAEFEEFAEQLAEKREEAYSAFTNRKQVLDEERKRRVGTLISSAGRILKGVQNRAETFKSVDEVNAYFASDIMVAKLRDIIEKLSDMGDSVKADDLIGQLKTTRDNCVRKLRDKIDLFAEGENIIKFGDYKFTVNTQSLELTTVYRDEEMYFHLTGTDFYEQIDDAEFLKTRDLWEQQIVSESRAVYRAEYLAHCILTSAVNKQNGLTLEDLTARTKAEDPEELASLVRTFAADRYNEGYEKGIHDHDATLILRAIVDVYNECELLRYDSVARSKAIIFWCFYGDDEHKSRLRNRMQSFGQMGAIFDYREPEADYIGEIRAAMDVFFEPILGKLEESELRIASEFLFYELQDAEDLLFTINSLAHQLYKRFDDHLKMKRVKTAFNKAVNDQGQDLKNRLSLIHHWVSTFVRTQEKEASSQHLIWEVVALIAAGDVIEHEEIDISTYREVDGCLGQHGLVDEKKLVILFDKWLLKMTNFAHVQVPRYEAYLHLRKVITERRREELRLKEFESRVLGSFVRNKLINDVYLNLVGANFAKQMGVAGEAKRTDLMGLLLLISPPGYGKTTLMEYISNRLGLTFMKINGPAIGHNVTSLDPAEAPNATAREEMKKLNLAFEMGNNIMIYLDDIQHCNPEFLQKFISLCDGSRRIEGVYRGQPKTYDLRGKKVTVVMAGNPYTESGDKFQIPDMLANRADTYNLGDISSTARDAFELSFIENAMTSNPVLSTISSRSHADLYKFMQILKTGSQEGLQFDYDYGAAEITEITGVLKKLRRIQQIVLKVNEQYIASAAQSDDYRTEPPFKLQGSYRNMCRMAEKVFPVMTEDEVDQLIIDHYYNESQTLTTGAESNLLKFKEVMGIMTDDDVKRWRDIKQEFNRRQTLAGMDESDQMGQIMAQLVSFNSGLSSINRTLGDKLDEGVANVVGGLKAAKGDLDFTPLVEALKTSKPDIDFTPLVKAMQSSKTTIDMAPLGDALKGMKQEIDFTPLVEALKSTKQEIDWSPLVEALGLLKLQAEPAKDEGALRPDKPREIAFPAAYAKAWDRQVTALECFLPILESIKLQNDTYLEMRKVLTGILDGHIQVKNTRPEGSE